MASPRASADETSRPLLPPGPAVFLPLSEEEASAVAGRKLPGINYRPIPLSTWYLISIMTLFLVFFGGLVALMAIDKAEPAWLRFDSTRSYNTWFYAPGLAGFITTILWRSTMQWYNRIIPYARMASLPLRQDPGRDESHYHVHSVGLNGTPGTHVNLGMLVFLWQRRDYLSFVVNFSQLFIFILTPLKTILFRLVEVEDGWVIHVSMPVCVGGAFIFAWLFVVTLCVLVFFRNHHTGLRWSPTTLATQISLLQGSNVFRQVADVDTTRFVSLPHAVRDWYELGWVLRLGYWKEERTGLVTYGVRFMSTDPERPLPDDEGSGPGVTSLEDDGIALAVFRDQSQIDDQERTSSPRGLHEQTSPWPTLRQDYEEVNMRAASPGEPVQDDITRIFNLWQMDPYICCVSAVSLGVLVTATVFWSRGDLAKSFELQILTNKASESNFSMSLRAERWLLLYLPLALFFGAFNLNFVSADLYHRTMAPVSKMSGRLKEEDATRISPFNAPNPIKGATARDSVLLDYLLPDPVSCVAKAVMEGEYRIAVGVVMASVSNTLYLLLAQLFHFDDRPGRGYSVRLNLGVFYGLYAILVVYLVSIWILRPRGPIRTCRPLYTLMDMAILVHQSPILLCPEFYCEPLLGLEEAQFQAQILIADRVYSYGVYGGMDGIEYVGVTVNIVPEAWVLFAASRPQSTKVIARLGLATELQRLAVRHSVYDQVGFPVSDMSKQAREAVYVRALLRKNRHRGWRRRAKSRLAARKAAR